MYLKDVLAKQVRVTFWCCSTQHSSHQSHRAAITDTPCAWSPPADGLLGTCTMLACAGCPYACTARHASSRLVLLADCLP